MGGADPTIAELERQAFALLRRGDVLGALRVAERPPVERRSTRLAVLAAEARVCLNRGDLDELESLRRRTAAEGPDERLGPRVEAALAEHHLVRGSAVCRTIADRALAPLADAPLEAPDRLWVRGRLWRTLAMADVLLAERPGRAGTLLERAKADFREAGFDAECARTAAEVECARAAATGEDVDRAHDTVVESLAWLRQLGSTYVDLVPTDRRMMWEHALVARVVAVRPPQPAGARVRLLGPEVDGERRSVRPSVARLVVVLVAEGGAAPADRVVDLLWPDADTATGRGRLRVALHRLRGLLRPEQANASDDDPVPRRGDLVALAPHVDVDAMQFEKLASGTDEDRRACLDLYGGDVAHAQLAYDDVAAPLRRRLAAIWRRAARDALADPGLSRPRVARIAALAGHGAPTDPELAELVRLADLRRP